MDCKSIATSIDANLKKLRDFALDSNLIDPTMYRQMIGSLMYLTNIRPDVCFTVNTLRKFLTDMRHVHLISTKHILRYLRGTIYYRLKYEANQKINLEGYVDLDWEGSATNRKSTSGCCFSLGSG